jgi:hypothetical protein
MVHDTNDLKVFISSRDSACDECKEDLGRGAWITLMEGKGRDAALTRRARKRSTLSAVVLKWSRARKRYERQGLLIEAQALEEAEKECLSDEEVRLRRRERAAERLVEVDRDYVNRFALRVRELYPGCPPGSEFEVAEHACRKYSGRVGRSAAAKSLEVNPVRLAVIAHIRHTKTRYDELLAGGYDRWDARSEVESAVQHVLEKWLGSKTTKTTK